MKKSLVALALLTAIGAASAQEANSGSQSGSSSGAQSGSISGVQSNNSGNTTAIGNQNASRSESNSASGASSGSMSGALGNAVYIDQSGPTSQTVNATSHSSVSGGTNNTDNVKYSGTVENRASGGYNNTSTETINQNVRYSGTQTIKNVPGIAMSGPASGPCTGASGGVGIAGPGFGVGLNGAKVDDGCTVRENTRILGQLYQSLDAANPAKAEAQAALLEGMAIIRNMNASIGGSYAPPPAPKQAQATPAPAPVVGMATTATDPYIKASGRQYPSPK